MVTLGQKLKLFREEYKFSQFNLENTLSLGFGSISRIESNKTIPTRKKIKKISDCLNITDQEFDYLIGAKAECVSTDKINTVINVTKNIWNDPTGFYILLDDYFRICKLNTRIIHLFNLDEYTLNNYIYLKNIIAVLLNPKLPFKKRLIKGNEELLIREFFYNMRYLRLEDSCNEVLKFINQDKKLTAILRKVKTENTNPSFQLNQRDEITVLNKKFIYEASKIRYTDRFYILELKEICTEGELNPQPSLPQSDALSN